MAKSFHQKAKLAAKDALHLACAVYSGADLLLTCDDQFVRYAKRLKLEIPILNPVDYVRRR